MKKICISILSVLVLSCVFSHAAYAQWTFTPTMAFSGACSQSDPGVRSMINELNATLSQFKTISFPDLNTCNQIRNILLNAKSSDGTCSAYFICTQCSGRDITAPGQGSNSTSSNPWSININGTSQGGAFFSNNPSQEINNWMDEWQLKYQQQYDWQKNINEGNWIVYQTTPIGPYTGNNANSTTYYQSGTYDDILQGMAQSIGKNVSDYFSKEDWEHCGANLLNMNAPECQDFNRRYNQFFNDVVWKSPMGNEIKTELVDVGIDVGAAFLTTGGNIALDAFFPEGAIIAKPLIAGGVEAAKVLAHNYNHGESMDWDKAKEKGAAGVLGGFISGIPNSTFEVGVALKFNENYTEKVILNVPTGGRVFSPIYEGVKTLAEGKGGANAAFNVSKAIVKKNTGEEGGVYALPFEVVKAVSDNIATNKTFITK